MKSGAWKTQKVRCPHCEGVITIGIEKCGSAYRIFIFHNIVQKVKEIKIAHFQSEVDSKL